MQSVAFRADASELIGTGHVMRCLTLADVLLSKGTRSVFICREHPGHLGHTIRERGHALCLLPLDDEGRFSSRGYTAWLGTSQERDAAVCRPLLERLRPDWLVADHYALDHRWESALCDHSRKLLVID